MSINRLSYANGFEVVDKIIHEPFSEFIKIMSP